MLAVQKVTLCAGDEKLTAVGVLPAVGHGQEPWRVVFEGEVLVGIRVAVNAGYARAIALYEITALDHEILNYAVEAGTFVSDGHAIWSVLSGAELAKVLRRARHCVCKQLKYHSADFLQRRVGLFMFWCNEGVYLLLCPRQYRKRLPDYLSYAAAIVFGSSWAF